MDAITLLRNDHRAVEKLFKAFEKAKSPEAKADAVTQIIADLSVHAVIEEQVFYPLVRREVPDAEDIVLESLEEHHIVKWVLAELEAKSPDAEGFDAKVTVLMENVRHHVEEEEHELFPQVRGALGRKRLSEMGDRMAELKTRAPKHPQPRQEVDRAAS